MGLRRKHYIERKVRELVGTVLEMNKDPEYEDWDEMTVIASFIASVFTYLASGQNYSRWLLWRKLWAFIEDFRMQNPGDE